MQFLRKHLLLFFFTLSIGVSFLFPADTFAQTISDFKSLFVTNLSPARNNNESISDPDRANIKSARSSGILYLGPTDFDQATGKLKAIKVVATLVFNDQINKPWNLVAARKCTSGFNCGAFFENRDYYRIYDNSFVIRFYQKNSTGEIINQKIVLPQNKSFVKNEEMKKLLSEKKPIPFLFKYIEGSSAGWTTWINAITSTTLIGFTDVFKIANDDDGYSGTDSILANAQVATLTFDGMDFDLGQTVYMDFWYAGAQQMKTDAWPDPAGYPNTFKPETNPETARILYFGAPAQENFPYFKIGATEAFVTPKNINDALSQQYVAGTEEASIQNNVASNRGVMPSCHPLNGFGPGEGSLMGCVGLFAYYIIFKPLSIFAWLMGQIFDFFIGYSISDEAYRHDFVITAWRLVRDISNIFFILIMVWTGLSAVFNTGNVSYKRVIPTLIVNALIINFSLFFSQLIIDVSNITARLFYNRIEVCKQEQGGASCNDKTGPAGTKSISEAIVSSFNPQKIFTDSNLLAPADSIISKEKSNDEKRDVGEVSFNANGQSKVTGMASDSNEYGAYFTLVSLLMAAISLGVGLMFWKTAFMFVGRIIGLYIAMIFSPFAFLSREVPVLGGIPAINYKEWMKEITGYALLAPIFVFFLYIIGQFLQTKFFSALGLTQNAENFFETVLYIVIPMLIIYGLIDRGVKIAEKFAGTYGKMVQEFATKATGLVAGAALGVATGGAAFAGTRAAGMFKLSETARAGLTAKRAEGGLAGRIASMRLSLNDRAQTSSFDFRKSKAFGGVSTLTGKMGIKLDDKISGAIGLGKDATKGGMKAIEKADKEKIKKKIESISTGVKDSEAANFWKTKSSQLAKIEEARLLKDTAFIEELRKEGVKDDGIEAAIKNAAQKNIKDEYGTVETNKQLTRALRQQFANTIAGGKTFGQSATAKVGGLIGVAGATVAVPSIVTAAGTLAPVTMTAIYDNARKNKLEIDEATSYAKKAKEDRNKNKLPKEERLEKEKAVIEKELESIDETLKKIFENEIATNPTHKDKTPEHFFNSPEDAREVINKVRAKMRSDLDVLDNEVEYFKKEYHEALKSKDDTKIQEAKNSMASKIVERNQQKDEYEKIDPQKKQRFENEINKKEDEIDKIKKAKEDKPKEDKPKEDKPK